MTIDSALMALRDVYQYGQLEKITLDQSMCSADDNWNIVSAQHLHRWLLLSPSTSCFFQIVFNIVHCSPLMMSEQPVQSQDLIDFKALLNASISTSLYGDTAYHKVSVFYPTLIKNEQVKREQDQLHLKEFVSHFFSFWIMKFDWRIILTIRKEIGSLF